VSESSEHAEEIEPDETTDNPLEPTPDFGEQEEVAQKQEWQEDAREGGE
jgi:hypothetical protein